MLLKRQAATIAFVAALAGGLLTAPTAAHSTTAKTAGSTGTRRTRPVRCAVGRRRAARERPGRSGDRLVLDLAGYCVHYVPAVNELATGTLWRSGEGFP